VSIPESSAREKTSAGFKKSVGKCPGHFGSIVEGIRGWGCPDYLGKLTRKFPYFTGHCHKGRRFPGWEKAGVNLGIFEGGSGGGKNTVRPAKN